MAAGDVVNDLQLVATGAFLNLQPASGIEWVIHNLHHGAEVELYFFDGTNAVKVAADPAEGSWLSFFLHCTNSRYYQLKNTNAASKYLGYDGIQTK